MKSVMVDEQRSRGREVLEEEEGSKDKKRRSNEERKKVARFY
jgi:hypothetical protein